MALPHLPPTYSARKSSAMEAAIVRRRDTEDLHRQKWEENAQYFHQTDLKMAKESDWTSEKAFQDSMDAFHSASKKERKNEDLSRRRRRLADLLNTERALHEARLRNLSAGNRDRLEELKDHVQGLKSAREVKRKELAEELMYEQFRKNNPDLRLMEWEQHKQQVVDSWGDQMKEKEEMREVERKRREEFELEMEERRREADAVAAEEEERKKAEERRLRRFQQRQMEEIRDREFEGERLKQLEAELLRQRIELEEMEKRRAEEDRARAKKEHGRILLRQHTAALKRKSKQIQDDLEADLKFLRVLEEREQASKAKKSARRERERADAAWMREVVEEQLRVEQAREAELDNLFQEEAARLWAKREDEWEREREARQRLMKEVLEERQLQIAEQLAVTRERQAASLVEREQLLEELEFARDQERHEVLASARAKQEHRSHLAAQMSARRDRQFDAEVQKAEEEEEERRAEKAYEEMLRREAERLRLRGPVAPSARRESGRRQAWQ